MSSPNRTARRHLETLQHRLNYLLNTVIPAMKRDDKRLSFRLAEVAALKWAVEQLKESHPVAVAQSRELGADS